jgi:hypothetical protein
LACALRADPVDSRFPSKERPLSLNLALLTAATFGEKAYILASTYPFSDCVGGAGGCCCSSTQRFCSLTPKSFPGFFFLHRR